MVEKVGGKKPAKPRVRKLPEALEEEIQRVATEIVEGRAIEARKVAALEVCNKLLARVADLLALAATGSEGSPVSPLVRKPVKQPVILHPCCMCGRESVYQDKTGKGGKPWYCRDHAALAVQSAREEATGKGLASALAHAEPINDATLPE